MNVFFLLEVGFRILPPAKSQSNCSFHKIIDSPRQKDKFPLQIFVITSSLRERVMSTTYFKSFYFTCGISSNHVDKLMVEN